MSYLAIVLQILVKMRIFDFESPRPGPWYTNRDAHVQWLAGILKLRLDQVNALYQRDHVIMVRVSVFRKITESWTNLLNRFPYESKLHFLFKVRRPKWIWNLVNGWIYLSLGYKLIFDVWNNAFRLLMNSIISRFHKYAGYTQYFFSVC